MNVQVLSLKFTSMLAKTFDIEKERISYRINIFDPENYCCHSILLRYLQINSQEIGWAWYKSVTYFYKDDLIHL